MQQWARKFGFGEPTGLDIGGEADGLVPTPEWRKKTFESDWDRAWNPGDSIQLAIGQKDLLVTPLQMAAFYAMLANGGNLVTPYLVSDVEQPARRARRASSSAASRRPAALGRRRSGALAAVRDGLYAATHSASGTSSGVFANYAVPISGKTGTAEKVVPLPGYPAGHLEDQSWWCGWGPSDSRAPRRLRAHRERRARLDAAAPAALKVFEKFFGVEAPRQPRGHRLSHDRDHSAPASPARGPAEPALIAFLRSLDWILMLAAVRASSATGSGSSRASRASTCPATRLLRRSAGRRRCARRGRARRRDARPRRPLAPVLEARLRGDARADDRRLRRRRDDPRLEALARPRRHPVPALRAREGPLRARDRRLPRRPRRPGRALEDDPVGPRARRGADPARVHAARPRHGARLRRGALRGPLLRRPPLAPAPRAPRGRRVSRSPPSSGCCQPPASRC